MTLSREARWRLGVPRVRRCVTRRRGSALRAGGRSTPRPTIGRSSKRRTATGPASGPGGLPHPRRPAGDSSAPPRRAAGSTRRRRPPASSPGRSWPGATASSACSGAAAWARCTAPTISTLGQPVALKFLPASVCADAERLARFRDEVRIARQVSHPNVCRVYDIGEVDGQAFLSMEYIDGEDLAVAAAPHRPPPAGARRSRSRARSARASRRRTTGASLHRDLKPANVMIDGRGQARITDFGLADAGDLRATGRGVAALAGTPAYMAPEQFEGRPATVQSDLYALGLVLYEIFTGKPAFTGTTVGALAASHRERAPSSMTALVGELDPAIERVILRCLEKDPASGPRRRSPSPRRCPAAIRWRRRSPGGDAVARSRRVGRRRRPGEATRGRGGARGCVRAPRGARRALGSPAGAAARADAEVPRYPGVRRAPRRRGIRLHQPAGSALVGVDGRLLLQRGAHGIPRGQARTPPPRPTGRAPVLVPREPGSAAAVGSRQQQPRVARRPAGDETRHDRRHPRSGRTPAGISRGALAGRRCAPGPARTGLGRGLPDGGPRPRALHARDPAVGAARLRGCAGRVGRPVPRAPRHRPARGGRRPARTPRVLRRDRIRGGSRSGRSQIARPAAAGSSTC